MTAVATAPIYCEETAARAFLEQLRWPEGVICIHCGAFGDAIASVQNTGKRTKPPREGKGGQEISPNQSSWRFAFWVPPHRWGLDWRLYPRYRSVPPQATRGWSGRSATQR